MIAAGILSTWLILTAAGFMGLSVLARAGEREEIEASPTEYELAPSTLAKTRPPVFKEIFG
jgi:hypothetical protein